MKKLLLFLVVLWVGHVAAQCPYYATCPTGTQLYCDYSSNDTLYWKAAPFTWNPGLMLSDLPETNIDLTIVARDSCGGQDVSVEYTLFLDLDGNDTAETVIRSNTAPPSGKVLYNNILSPNYALGDIIEFDHRTGLPDSMKYRFGLELTRIADLVIANLKWSTGIEVLNYSTPKFPLGKHRIVWRIEQGGVEQFCEYGMEVKDCAPPVVTCVEPLIMNISPITGEAFLSALEMVQDATDNITPSDKLIFSIRLPWYLGTGFPLDGNGNPITTVQFNCIFAYDSWPLELWVKDLAGKTDSCVTSITILDSLGICVPIEPSNVSANVKTLPWDEGIEEVLFQLDVTSVFLPPFSLFDYSDTNGHSQFNNNVLPSSNLILTPSRNDSPLNGVTTYDLVLMSKHILGIETLNSPYKMIAADANKSGSVTTFDIVETRKLILGLYDSLPNNKSWRFLPKSFAFPNPLNPFQTIFPENVVQQNWSGNSSQFEFVGFKVGDVNNTAVPNATTQPPAKSRAPNFLRIQAMKLETGATYEIPIYTTEIADWLGLQFSLDFDPELIDVEGIESSFLPNFDQNNWAQPQAGRLRLSWSSAIPANISPSAEMLRLRIKARANTPLSKVFKRAEKSTFQSEAYDSKGVARPLQIVFSEITSPETVQVFAPQPNPTLAGATLPIQLSQAENLRLEVRDLSGKLLWVNDLSLEKDSHALEIPASAMPQAGVYVWRVQSGAMVKLGKITKG